MRAVLDIVIIVLDLYVWLLIASAILSWLIAFNVLNTRNAFVAAAARRDAQGNADACGGIAPGIHPTAIRSRLDRCSRRSPAG